MSPTGEDPRGGNGGPLPDLANGVSVVEPNSPDTAGGVSLLGSTRTVRSIRIGGMTVAKRPTGLKKTTPPERYLAMAFRSIWASAVRDHGRDPDVRMDRTAGPGGNSGRRRRFTGDAPRTFAVPVGTDLPRTRGRDGSPVRRRWRAAATAFPPGSFAIGQDPRSASASVTDVCRLAPTRSWMFSRRPLVTHHRESNVVNRIEQGRGEIGFDAPIDPPPKERGVRENLA